MARFKVGQKGFASNHLLNINAVIESKDDKPNILFDVIYLEFAEGRKVNNTYGGYDNNNKIDMKFNAHELRILVYALKGLIASSGSNYKKYSNPSLANSNDGVKELSLGFKGDKYFFNIEETNKKKFSIPFGIYELKALIDSMIIIADETDATLYKYQREIDKRINAEKNQGY